MKRIVVVALAVLGVCMATTASASAHLFHASKLGTLLGTQTGSQVFTTTSEGSKVTCTKAATTGSITALLGLHQLVTVIYTGCTALAGFVTTDITPAQYLLSADGLAAIENTINITVLAGFGLGCSIKVGPQNLGTVKFDPNGAGLIELSAVKGIVSTGSGGECGTNNTGGTYTGNSSVIEDGGSIGWS